MRQLVSAINYGNILGPVLVCKHLNVIFSLAITQQMSDYLRSRSLVLWFTEPDSDAYIPRLCSPIILWPQHGLIRKWLP